MTSALALGSTATEAVALAPSGGAASAEGGDFVPLQTIAAGFLHSVVIGSAESKLKLQNQNPETPLDTESEVRVHACGARKHHICGTAAGIGRAEEKDHHVQPVPVDFFDGRQVAQADCGGSHTIFLAKRADQMGGRVWACGLGAHGRLGVRRPSDRSACQALMEASEWPAKQQRIRDEFTDSVLDSGSSAWSAPLPLRIRFPEEDVKIAYICCGSDHTLALSSQGGVFAWGLGSFGNLGNGTTEDSWTPRRVRIPNNGRCRMVAAGGKHSMALTSEGAIFSWGHGGNGRLGQGERCEAALLPAAVQWAAGAASAEWIAAAEAHSACVDALGGVFVWGAASYGRIGDGVDTDAPLPRPVLTLSGSPCKRVELGTVHSLALTIKGEVYGWGTGAATGVLPPGSEEVQALPAPIGRDRPLKGDRGPALHARPVVQIAAGCFHSLALQAGGRLFAWGLGGHGRLGLDSDLKCADQAYPEILITIKGWQTGRDRDQALDGSETVPAGDDRRKPTDLHSVACGGMHTVARTQNGALWSWGCGQYGQTGHGNDEDTWVPNLMQPRGLRMNIRTVALGLEHALAVTSGFELVAWGRNQCGQLGFGTTADTSTPQIVHDLPDVVAVGAGEDHSAALLTSGNLYTWGSAESGKLGHGSGMSSGTVQVPRNVRFAARFMAVNCGPQHTAIIDHQGIVYTFGAGWFGRLGHGDMNNEWKPKAVENFAVMLGGISSPIEPCEIKSVQCASYHTCVLSKDGRLWCTGRDWCLCGTQHVTSFTLFDQMREPNGGEVKLALVAAAHTHTLILSEEGTLFGWGDNYNGVLGLGAGCAERISEPTIISCKAWTSDRRTKLVDIATGEGHSMALTLNGDLYAWGVRSGGRLGFPYKESTMKSVWAPARVKPNWHGAKNELIDADVDDANAQGAGEGTAGGSDGESDDKWDLPSIQKKLWTEPPDHKKKALAEKEKRLSGKYEKYINDIFSLWTKPSSEAKEGEWTLRELRKHYDRSVCRNVRRMGLFEDCPNLDIKIHPEVSQKLVYFEEIMWILQQQPCYLARLAGKLSLNTMTILKGRTHEKLDKCIEDCRIPPDVLPRVVRCIFREMEDSRTRHLCMAFLRKMVEVEVEQVYKDKKNFDTAFDVRNSLVAILLQGFVKGIYFREMHNLLFDMNNPESLISRVFDISEDILFAMHESDLLPFEHGVGATNDASQLEREVLEHLRARLVDNLFNFFIFLGCSPGSKAQQQLPDFFAKVKMPQAMSSLFKVMKKAHRVMEILVGDKQQINFGEEDADPNKLSDKELQVIRPLVRLFLTSVLGELLVNHEQLMTSGQAAALRAHCEKKLREAGVVEDETKKGKKSNAFFGRRVASMQHKVHFNLTQLGKFITRSATGNYSGCHASVKQAGEHFKDAYIAEFMDKKLQETIDDTGTKMLIDMYCSHYQLKTGSVIMSTLDLLHLSNALWMFQKDAIQAEASNADDQNEHHHTALVQERLSQLLLDVMPPVPHEIDEDKHIFARVDEEDKARLQLLTRIWRTEVLATVQASSVNHNFMIQHRFLERNTDLCFCRDCDAPIPRMIASSSQRKPAALRLVKPYKPLDGRRIDGGYPFLELQTMLADPDLDAVTQKDFILMKFELEEMQKKLNTKMQSLSLHNRSQKDYDLVSRLDKAKKVLDTMKNANVTEAMFADYIKSCLRHRRAQFDYLMAAEEGLDQIGRAQEKYQEVIGLNIMTMRKAVEMSEGLVVPSLVRQRASDCSTRLMFDKLDKMRKAEERSARAQSDIGTDDFAAAASATYSLYTLRAKGVIARMAEGEGRLSPKEYKNVHFTFSCNSAGDWSVEVIYGHPGKKHQRLCGFEIFASDLERMKSAGKTAKLSFNDDFVTINCFNLLQLVCRIGAT